SMPSKRHLLRRSMLVGFFSFAGSATGILVEISIAAHLGLSRGSDTFYVALTVPYIITNLITATGQFTLVPFFSSFDTEERRGQLWYGFSYALNLVASGLILIAILGAAFAPWIIRGIAPGLMRGQSLMSTRLARWLFLMIVPAGAAEVFRSFLFSQHRFALSSAAGFFRNVSIIAFIWFGFHRFADYSIVMGYCVGYCAQLCILGGQVAWSFPARYRLTLRGAGKPFRQLHGAGASQILAAAGSQAMVIVERVIASFLPPGTITALNYGLKIISTLSELLAGSVGTSVLPALSRAVSRQAEAEERKIIQNAIEIALVLVSLVTACCLALPGPIMQLLFQRGNFSAEATARMALIFFCYCLCLLPLSGLRLLNFYLFARHAMTSFLSLAALYTALACGLYVLFVLVLHLGAKGIPLGLLAALILTGAAAYGWDVAGIQIIFDHALAVLAGKDLAALVISGIVMWRIRLLVRAPHGVPELVVFLCVVCGIGCMIFFAIALALKAVSLSQMRQVFERS
ncbi:MAG TPA: lipid II flippase MurJ, partial [Terriglobia bacterium]|nr:lipid II flippase MurJ [Terriglobia bacterium]